MRFEERELKPYSEPVSPKELKIGVVLAAAVFFMGSVLILLSGILNARLFAYAVLPFCFSLLGVIASVGLFGLREWARKTAIFLSVAPVTICGLLFLLQPNAIFQPDAGIKYAILTVGDLGIVVYVCMFVALIPVSVWWLIRFTRESVRSEPKDALTRAHRYR
jgi:hypothetical protein